MASVQDPHKTTMGRLRILATTDLHMHLMPHDYFTDTRDDSVGLVRTASLIERLRAEAPGAVVLVDNGDFLQGNPLADWMAEPDSLSSRVHPMIAAMNRLGYDAGTLGNHEFNYGLEFLRQVLSQARFPVVSANLALRDPAAGPLVPPFAVLPRMIACSDGQVLPLRIGLLGVAPPQVTRWDAVVLGDRVVATDIVKAARLALPRLRAAGADLVVALCHSGIGPEHHAEGMENAAVPLAALDGIDAIVTGHVHGVFPGDGFAASDAVDPRRGRLHGKPAVMAGFFGSHLGRIDLTLAVDGAGWRVAGADVGVHPVAARRDGGTARPLVRIHRPLARSAVPLHRAIRDRIRAPIGETALPLHSYFAMVAPDRALQVVSDAQKAFARRILAGRPEAGLPLVSAVAPFRFGGQGGPGNYIDIPAGRLAMRHASELYPYPNSVCILALPGRAIGDWLERSAAAFCRIEQGQCDQPLLTPGFPPYLFDVLDGVTCTFDLTRPAASTPAGESVPGGGGRVRDLRLGGRPLDPDRAVLVVTNSYRAGGGGGFEAALQGESLHEDTRTVRDLVLDHVAASGRLAPDAPAHWRFAPLPGTGAWFDTGPGALAHEAPAGIAPSGPARGGFHRFTLRFAGGAEDERGPNDRL
ncbi:MAG: bifunctional 2',3'-cyclic-nucleotide 2'-phosphodiesterase/3'-nucleotidase [Rubellimicrobium sp.]|nr:bifunctional 2',3'-cyclic-nucleotide 2'-phosphodiesterase/3'-nucleotidase [Rubellimicrobium sp.]